MGYKPNKAYDVYIVEMDKEIIVETILNALSSIIRKIVRHLKMQYSKLNNKLYL